MTRDDIIRMALEAGWRVDFEGEILEGDDWHIQTDIVERFANLVAAEIVPKETLAEMFEWGKDAGRREEREACAKVCDRIGDEFADANPADCAFAIRERGAP